MEKPIIFKADQKDIDDIIKIHKVVKIIDFYKEQLFDLFLVRNPKYRFNKNYKEDFEKFLQYHCQNKPLEKCGNWVYFPWNGYLVHFLEDKLHQEIRTARNRNLITKEEQEKLYNTKIAIGGLSVGSHVAISCVLMGMSKEMKLADADILAPSNLNRMKFDFTNIGKNKAELVAEYIYQINPYSKIEIYPEGINDYNLSKFLSGIDILVDELDDIEIKVKLREEAKIKKIPVLMATDNFDNVIIDIERYDLNPDLSIFNGRLKDLNLKDIKKSPQKLFEAMAEIIDIDLVPSKMTESVFEIGKTLYSWPQLITAASISGAVIGYVIRKIILGERIKDGKLEVNLDYIFSYPEDYEKELKKRSEINKKFWELLKLLK